MWCVFGLGQAHGRGERDFTSLLYKRNKNKNKYPPNVVLEWPIYLFVFLFLFFLVQFQHIYSITTLSKKTFEEKDP